MRQERKTQVLQVARQLFAERGYHETSIQNILDGAAIARGTFYLHFDSKRAIFAELIDEFLRRLQGGITQVSLAAGAPPPLQQIEENLHRVLQLLRENRELTRIILNLAEGLDAEIDATMARFFDRLVSLLRTAVVNGQALGLVRPCDPAVVAQAALGSLKELGRHYIVQRDASAAELSSVARELLTFSLIGLFETRYRPEYPPK